MKSKIRSITKQYAEAAMMKGVFMPYNPYNYITFTDYSGSTAKYETRSANCSGYAEDVLASDKFKKAVINTVEEHCKETKEEKKEKNVYQIRRRHYGDFTFLDENGYNKRVCIDKVIFNPPATIILWNDKTRTVVKCREGETFDKHTGFAMCVVKKLYGPDFHYILNKYGGKTEEETEEQPVRMTLDEWRKQVGRVEKAFSSALKSMDKGGNNEL